METQGSCNRLVVALTIDGHLRALEHVSKADDLDALGRGHSALTLEAERQGKTWMIDIIDPGGDMPATRMSNDPTLMCLPVMLTPEAIEQWLARIAP